MSDRLARMSVLLSAMGVQRWQSRSSRATLAQGSVASVPVPHSMSVDRSPAAHGESAPRNGPTRLPAVSSMDANQRRKQVHTVAGSAIGPVDLSMWRTARALIFAPSASSFPVRFLADLKRAVDGRDTSASLVELPAFLWPPEGSPALVRTASMVSALRALIQREGKKRPLHFVLMFGDIAEVLVEDLVPSTLSSSSSVGVSWANDGHGRRIQVVVLPAPEQFLADPDSKRALWQKLRGPQ